MKKIPSIYFRDFDGNPRYVLRSPNPECDWVFRGEGKPTRKWDGTCVLIRDGEEFARRQVKKGKGAPANFEVTEFDEHTGIAYGWESAAQSGFATFIDEALRSQGPLEDGTYELIGPKIQSNPEKCVEHQLVRHGAWVYGDVPDAGDFDALAMYVLDQRPVEGIVWHHPDGRMAKIKASDFPDTFKPYVEEES